MPAMQITSGRPFRGSSALAAGALTRGVLYGPGYRRLYPDIHVAATSDLDLEIWSRAAHELVAPHGVLAGYSAAELHGASCTPAGAPAEVILLDGYRRRAGPMLVVHLDAVARNEITDVDGISLTTPERTAADLARWARSLTEAVVAVDALSFACGFDPEVITDLVVPGGRGAAACPASSRWQTACRSPRWRPASGWRSSWRVFRRLSRSTPWSCRDGSSRSTSPTRR
jgi:hypothetical protein